MLPRVSPDIFHGRIASMGDGENNLTILTMSRMREENPVIYETLIDSLGIDEWSEEFKEGFFRGVINTYDLLRTQAEVDELEV
jgi:hypothetical protein